MHKDQGKSFNKIAMENIEHHVESGLNVEELDMKNNIKNEKDTFR